MRLHRAKRRSALFADPSFRIGKFFTTEDLHWTRNEEPKKPCGLYEPGRVGDDGDLFECREMLNSQLRVVPHRARRVAREILTSAEQEANFLMSFEHLVDSGQKYILIILGPYRSTGRNGQNVVRHSGNDLDHCFGAASSFAIGIPLFEELTSRQER